MPFFNPSFYNNAIVEAVSDVPVYVYGTPPANGLTNVLLQVTHAVGGGGSVVVTAKVVEGNLPISPNDAVTLGNNTAADLDGPGTVAISSIQSQNLTTGVIVFTLPIDTTFNGDCAGQMIVVPSWTGEVVGGNQASEAVCLPEDALGVSWDYTSSDGGVGSIQLEGALELSGPWSIIGTALTDPSGGSNIASLPSGARFVRLNPTVVAGHLVARICAF